MTYFTDSIYERMMMQKPKYGREKTTPASGEKNPEKKDKPSKEPIPNSQKRSVKE